ncbi:hypothetical protein Tsubulata_000516 [Turnera subulata]|uniref:TFIIE beta domain-containing protein n=1 Tax=Turnera subulata TaxID=218843 RepID=A0A9Q0JRC9_9ROSI|nr:hypothetical protein Tsubulata_000516 [Turnera subulata]
MALQEQLNKFKRQQEKCQNTLSSIASRPGPSKSSVAAAPSISATPSAPAVKFSNDTERLQHINSIRKAPIGAQIKRVIDLLLETRQALTPQQINEACFVDVNSNKAVFDSLKNNLKVSYDGRRFAYKSKHDIKDKAQLTTLIRKFLEGIAVIDLKDAYPTVMEDLQPSHVHYRFCSWIGKLELELGGICCPKILYLALKAEGSIWLLANFDSQEDIAYPNDPRMIKFKVDDDLKLLFRGIELPRDMLDIEKDLQKNGMKPATNTAKRRAAAQVQGIAPKQKTKKKKHEISKRTKLTNAHLPELFQNLGS